MRAVRNSPLGVGYHTTTTGSYSTFLYQFDSAPNPSFLFTQKYDTVTDLWVSVKRLPTLRNTQGTAVGSAGAATVGNAIYVCGGATPPAAAGAAAEAYYPVTDTWTTKRAMPGTKGGPSIGASSSKVFVTGGPTATFYIYDVTTDAWAAGTNGPRALLLLPPLSVAWSVHGRPRCLAEAASAIGQVRICRPWRCFRRAP
jgi:hypothetical protein